MLAGMKYRVAELSGEHRYRGLGAHSPRCRTEGVRPAVTEGKGLGPSIMR